MKPASTIAASVFPPARPIDSVAASMRACFSFSGAHSCLGAVEGPRRTGAHGVGEAGGLIKWPIVQQAGQPSGGPGIARAQGINSLDVGQGGNVKGLVVFGNDQQPWAPILMATLRAPASCSLRA
jgi:hypothetical protein